MSIVYEILPLPDLTAPRVVSQRTRSINPPSDENKAMDFENARSVLESIGIDGNACLDNTIEVQEKYMVETHLHSTPPGPSMINPNQKGPRKPHYTHLVVYYDNLVFQGACCLPLKIVAASLDGHLVSGRRLFNTYSEDGGGKLVYEFTGNGRELIIDLKRGNSTRVQRLIFKGIYA